MSETKRFLLAGFLLAVLFFIAPFYLQLIGINDSALDSAQDAFDVSPEAPKMIVVDQKENQTKKTASDDYSFSLLNKQLKNFTITTDVANIIASSGGGGSLLGYSLNSDISDGYKYLGGYDDGGVFHDSLNVSLMLDVENDCSPCLVGNYDKSSRTPIGGLFNIISPDVYDNQNFFLTGDDSLVVEMVGKDVSGSFAINKKTTYYGNKYIVNHKYSIKRIKNGGAVDTWSLVWAGGIRNTEKNQMEELTYSQAYLAQNKEIFDFSVPSGDAGQVLSCDSYSGKTDWVAMRNKYFINALVSKNATGGVLGGENYQFGSEFSLPAYLVGLDFAGGETGFSAIQYFGPLDVDYINQSNSYLDRVMNFGWLPIQPFSRTVLWLLKFLNGFGINYGLILIFFALGVRIITGPLTKKSFESSAKMQEIQPKIKNIQKKYKNDSQRMNREMMALYKERGVNPLGGCLPMLIQMPLLFSLFIVFRSTIEFRGAPFFGWINNLSQPDTIFNLPFYIPIYGDQVAFLPVLLGVSMFLSQKLSMASMDSNQKPMMYMMSAFFFLLFNSFPSGLNLYYVMYNLLNYQQQLKMKRG